MRIVLHLRRRLLRRGVHAALLLMTFGVSTQACPVPSAAQERDTMGLKGQSENTVHVVLPADATTDSTHVRALITTIRSSLVIPGLPRDLLLDRDITVRLVTETLSGRDASSYPTTGTIVLPVEYWDWDYRERVRIVQHELAHVALGIFFEFARLPHWFEEGFAEWAVGGLNCKGEARVRLDLLVRRRSELTPPTLEMPDSLAISRLAYDYYGTFFGYVDARVDGSVTSGRLLREVRSHGIGPGFVRAVGENLETIEASWREDLISKYGTIPDGFSCP